jgi:hypothetical protein
MQMFALQPEVKWLSDSKLPRVVVSDQQVAGRRANTGDEQYDAEARERAESPACCKHIAA